MSLNSFEKFIPSVEEDEKYFIAHILKNPQELNLISENQLKTSQAKQFYKTISSLYNDDHIEKYDNTLIKRNNINLEQDYVDDIFRIRLKDKEYLNHCIKNIKDYEVKLHIGKTTEDFLTQITAKGDLNYEIIRTLANDILHNTVKLDDDSSLRTYKDLTSSYRDTLKRRIAGEGRKSLGFKSLDRIVIRPAAPGEMTTLFGMKGSGKSLFAKSIETMLINSGVPVISINLEMTEESNMDRKISVATNYSLEQLLDYDFLQSEENIQFIEDSLLRLEEKKNYIYYSEPEISLDGIDKLAYKSRQYFADHGVLPKDGYMFMTSDLTEQVEELSGRAGTELKPGVNKILKICKKYNMHKMNILQSNENLFRSGRMFSSPEACDSFCLQPEHVEGGAVYAARSRVVMAVNRPLTLKRRFFPEREEEWNLEEDIMWANIVKQNDSPFLSRASFVFGSSSFRLIPYKFENNTN
jgi:energy-coupling factor transporter ATP-binding protein EcfA2